MYRLTYWSTLQEHGKANPYGHADYTDKEEVERQRAKLMLSKDIYRMETWQRIENWEREIGVEEYHGNPNPDDTSEKAKDDAAMRLLIRLVDRLNYRTGRMWGQIGVDVPEARKLLCKQVEDSLEILKKHYTR